MSTLTIVPSNITAPTQLLQLSNLGELIRKLRKLRIHKKENRNVRLYK